MACIERVGRVTVVATKVAKGQTNKDARQSGPGAFSLDRPIDLVDRERWRLVLHVKKINECKRYGNTLGLHRTNSERFVAMQAPERLLRALGRAAETHVVVNLEKIEPGHEIVAIRSEFLDRFIEMLAALIV